MGRCARVEGDAGGAGDVSGMNVPPAPAGPVLAAERGVSVLLWAVHTVPARNLERKAGNKGPATDMSGGSASPTRQRPYRCHRAASILPLRGDAGRQVHVLVKATSALSVSSWEQVHGSCKMSPWSLRCVWRLQVPVLCQEVQMPDTVLPLCCVLLQLLLCAPQLQLNCCPPLGHRPSSTD